MVEFNVINFITIGIIAILASWVFNKVVGKINSPAAVAV